MGESRLSVEGLGVRGSAKLFQELRGEGSSLLARLFPRTVGGGGSP